MAYRDIEWRHRTRKRKVDSCPADVKSEVEERLGPLGESPTAVSAWLKSKGINVSERTLRNYRVQVILPRRALFTRDFCAEYSRYLTTKFDALEELRKMIVIQTGRLYHGLSNEQTTGVLKNSNTMAINMLQRSLVDLVNLELALGIRQKTVPENTIMSDSALKDLLEKVVNGEKKYPRLSPTENDPNDNPVDQ